MLIGITMLKVVPGKEKSVYCILKGQEGILDVYHVFGEYDFFVILHAEGLERLNLLMQEVQGIHDITLARTVLVGYDSDRHEFNPARALICPDSGG